VKHRSQDTTGLFPATGSPESVMREKGDKKIKRKERIKEKIEGK